MGEGEDWGEMSHKQKVKELPGVVRRRTQEVIAHEKLFKDKNFTPEDWARHKTWHRFSPNLLIAFRVLSGFAGPVFFHTMFAACVCIYHGVLEDRGAPKFWDHNTNMWQPFSLSSFCLALLLVHRTTTTYNRWWEGRTAWGAVLNLTRNLMRECASPWGFPREERALLEMMARCIIAMPYCLRAHLKFEPVADVLDSLLPQEEVKFLVNAPQPCLRVAQWASEIVGQAMPGMEFHQTRLHLDEQIVLFVNLVGACERIYKTPVPHAFNRHLARFLNVWLLFLPFALWPVTGWATIFVELALAYLLIATENIGIQIEEPFSIMPLMEFCKGMEKSVVDIMESYLSSNKLVSQIKASGSCLGFKRSDLPVIRVIGEQQKTVGHKMEKVVRHSLERVKSFDIRPSLDRRRSGFWGNKPTENPNSRINEEQGRS